MVQLIITITDDGQFKVEGPIHNPLQCHGMMGMAAHVVNSLATKQAEQRVQLAPAGILGIQS